MQTGISQKVRKEVILRDSYDGCPCCIYCGHPSIDGKGLHLHHIKRRSQLGEGSKENLVTLCFSCHSKIHSGNQDIQEFCEDYLRSKYETI